MQLRRSFKPDGRTTIYLLPACCGETWHRLSRFLRKSVVGNETLWRYCYSQGVVRQLDKSRHGRLCTRARRPRVLVEPSESLGIRSCCERSGNHWWKAGRVVGPCLACPQLPVPASGHGCRGERQVNSLGYAQLAVNQLPSKLPQLYC